MADRLYKFIFGEKNTSKPQDPGKKDPVREDQEVTQPSRSATPPDRSFNRPPPIGGRNPANKEALDAAGMAEGGPVAGPGGPTSDSIPARLSNGEYVIPAGVVSYLGQKFFDDLVRNAQLETGEAQPEANAFTEMAEDDDVMPQGMAKGGYVIGKRRC